MPDSPKNNFRFFLPIKEISKAKDENGNEVMKFGGIASTKRRDTDGEILDFNGFDISYLQERGIVNWSHSSAPEDIIGEPTKAEIRKEGLYVESILYPDSKKAKKVYELAQTLKKSKASRRLGYSIEGKTIARDPLDNSKVIRAKITNVAICVSPKNPDSVIDIIKGNFHGWADNEKPPVMEKDTLDIEKIIKSEEQIVDIVRPDKMRVIVDKDYNVKIQKSEDGEEEENDDDNVEEAMTTSSSSGQAVQHESVDGETKDQRNSKLKKAENEVEETLTKEEVIQKILNSNSVISFEKAEKIYQNLNNLTMAQNGKTKITDDLLEKSLDKLGFKKAEREGGKYHPETGNKTKRNGLSRKEEAGDMEDDIDFDEEDDILDGDEPQKKKRPDPVKIGKANTNKMKKGNDEKDPEEEDRDEEDNEEEEDEEPMKRKATKKPMKKAIKKAKDEDDDDDDDEEEAKPFKKIKKSITASYISETDDMAELKDMVKSLAVISKASYDLAKSQADELNELREQFEEWGEAPAQQRKSVMSKGIKQREFTKGMGAEDILEKSEDGKPIVDVDLAKGQILNMLDTMSFKNNVYNETFGKAMRMFEAASVMEPSIQKAVENEFQVHLVRRK